MNRKKLQIYVYIYITHGYHLYTIKLSILIYSASNKLSGYISDLSTLLIDNQLSI